MRRHGGASPEMPKLEARRARAGIELLGEGGSKLSSPARGAGERCKLPSDFCVFNLTESIEYYIFWP